MIGLRRALAGLWLAGLVAGIIAVLLTLDSTFEGDPVFAAALGAAIGWSFIATGLYAWLRRPENRFGALLVGTGFAWFLCALVSAHSSLFATIGLFLNSFFFAPLVHALLAYPSGRLETRRERALVLATYLVVTVGIWSFLVFTPSQELCDSDCAPGTVLPDNAFLISDKPTLRSVLEVATNVAGLLLVVAIAWTLWQHWRAAGRGLRRTMAPVLWGGVAILLAAAGQLFTDTVGAQGVGNGFGVATLLALLSVPLGFLFGILRIRFTRAGKVGALVERLGGSAGPVNLRDVLADALEDPTLQLIYWVPDLGAYVDADGRAVELPPARLPRGCAEVDRDGDRVAAILYDATVVDDPALVRTAGNALALALANERLQAELRARYEDLRASRARIVEAAYAERRRIERDLHDGAQQRLVSLALSLGLARSSVDSDPALAVQLLGEAEAETRSALGDLRELARGIHPAVLTDRGLDAALEALAGRAPLPVELVELPRVRLPEAVESAAYFVVSEALTNVAKYAHATEAEVRVARENGGAVIEVRDDGIGGADPAGGSGLRGLADRISALDGRLRIDSPPGRGTIVRAEIPCAS